MNAETIRMLGLQTFQLRTRTNSYSLDTSFLLRNIAANREITHSTTSADPVVSALSCVQKRTSRESHGRELCGYLDFRTLDRQP